MAGYYVIVVNGLYLADYYSEKPDNAIWGPTRNSQEAEMAKLTLRRKQVPSPPTRFRGTRERRIYE